MHSFFIAPQAIASGKGFLDAEESAHAARVLRLRAGEVVRLIDAEGNAFEGELTAVDPKKTAFSVLRGAPSHESPVRVTLYQGLPKADKLELITQKATELGIYRIVPVEMRYCVAKAGKPGKDSRLTRIAREAVKQSGRSRCPVVESPMSFALALADMQKRRCMLMPWENARGRTIASALREGEAPADIGILIGPEGGISAEEAEAVSQIGGLAVTLGERILRTETAAITASALAIACAEERLAQR